MRDRAGGDGGTKNAYDCPSCECSFRWRLALLKGEGKFTARVGRVKIYCRASVDGRRSDGSSRGVPSEAVKLHRKSNNDCQGPT